MKVRIKVRPREPELDGVRLDGFAVGTTREVSPSIGTWLVAQGYADLEMRSIRSDDEPFPSISGVAPMEARRRSDD